MQIVRHIFFCFLCLLACTAFSQELDETRENWIANKITDFIDEYDQLANDPNLEIRITEANLKSESYPRLLSSRLGTLNISLQALDFRWNAFSQNRQTDIAASEFLMNLMTQVQQLRQTAADTIAAQQNRCNAIVDFIKAEQLIYSQDTVYKELYRKAKRLSLVKQQAPQLEKVKAQEQVLFEKLQASYEKSKTATQLIPQLAKRSERLDDQFFALKALSTNIQSMKYEPPIQRIKDYLMSLAYVAVILIFINMVTTKLQAAKKARDMMKKQQDLFKKTNNEDYPTI